MPDYTEFEVGHELKRIREILSVMASIAVAKYERDQGDPELIKSLLYKLAGIEGKLPENRPPREDLNTIVDSVGEKLAATMKAGEARINELLEDVEKRIKAVKPMEADVDPSPT